MTIAPMPAHPEQDRHDTRALVRLIAGEMAASRDVPNAEKVRKEIQARTGGTLNPSTLTVQDEMKKWMADTFWPTYHLLGELPADSDVPNALRALYAEGFQRIVAGAIEAAGRAWEEERRGAEQNRRSDWQTIADLTGRVDELSHELSGARDERDALQQKLVGIDAMRMDLQGQLEKANAALQAANEAQARQEREIAEIRETERRQAQDNIEATRDETRRALREVDELRQTVKAGEKTTQRLGEELMAMRERAVKAETKIETLIESHGTETRALAASHAAELTRLSKPAADPKTSPIRQRGLAARGAGMRRIKNTLK